MNKDGNPQGKDALPGANDTKGQPSDQNGENPSNQPKTFTEEEVKKMVSERHSTLDRQIADLTKQLTDAKSQLSTYQKEKEDAELEKVKDDPEKLSAYQLRKQARELTEIKKGLEERLAQLESELEEERKLSAPLKIAPLVKEVAEEFEGLDPDKLAKLVVIAKVTSKEDIRAIAETIGTLKEPEESGKKEDFKPFSGKGIGGGIDISKMTSSQLIQMGLEAEKKKRN